VITGGSEQDVDLSNTDYSEFEEAGRTFQIETASPNEKHNRDTVPLQPEGVTPGKLAVT